MHRTLVSTRPERPVSGSSEDAGVGLRPDAGSLRDRTLEGVRLVTLMWQHVEETLSDRMLGESDQA